MPTVDIHTHVVPEFILEAASTESTALFGMRYTEASLTYPGGFTHPVTADLFSLDAVLARMDQAGITASVISLSPNLFVYDQPPDVAVDFARSVNDAFVEMARSSPRIAALGQLPMQLPDVAAEELARAVGLGLRGALIGTNIGDQPLDSPSFRPVLEMAESLDVPLVLHPYFVGPKPRLEPFYLTNSIGNPLDTCIAAARLIHTGTMTAFPRLKVALVHGAGFLPYQLGRLDHSYAVREEARVSISEPPSSFLSRFWIDTITHSDGALAFLAGMIGTTRLVVGTDCPYDMADAQPIERLCRVGVNPDELGDAALELVGLSARDLDSFDRQARK